MKDQEPAIVKYLIQLLTSKIEHMEGIYLFGSRAQLNNGPHSDWDFAFLCKAKGIEEIIYGIKVDLESKFDVSLDLIDLYKANTIFQIQVMKTGKLIWVADKHKIDEFEYLTLSYYQKLNDERADILKDIKSRGSIYG